jgi:hypothetical protein
VRKEFEKWLIAKGWPESTFWKNGDEYGYSLVAEYWEAYQAGYEQCDKDNFIVGVDKDIGII